MTRLSPRQELRATRVPSGLSAGAQAIPARAHFRRLLAEQLPVFEMSLRLDDNGGGEGENEGDFHGKLLGI